MATFLNTNTAPLSAVLKWPITAFFTSYTIEECVTLAEAVQEYACNSSVQEKLSAMLHTSLPMASPPVYSLTGSASWPLT